MLNFEPFSMAVLQKALPYIRTSSLLCSDISAGSLFMWRSGSDVRFCVWNDTFVLQLRYGGQIAFSWPIGNDPDGMLDELLFYVREHHLPLRFFAVDEGALATLRADKRLQPAGWAYDPRWSDYLYDFEDMLTFRGRKFSGQRNHINKFKRLYGEPVIRFLRAEDRPRVDAMLEEYAAEHDDGEWMEKKEFAQAKRLLDACEELGLYAACMTVDDEPVAFSIGEIVGDTLIVHVEKALRRFAGAYPTMVTGFVQLMAEHSGAPLRRVNREDDAGDPGLRTSKQQYQPIGRVHKYLVHVHSPAARMETAPVIAAGRVVLTAFRESDKAAYLALNTDVENNRYWGYDYREDPYIVLPVDENTFYDGVQHDMRAGDSINFAVRLSADGDMVGEGILWNFTNDGTAEVGCRLTPAVQGGGHGKAAFAALADYAEQTLKLRVWARCYRENEASRRMILASRFHPTREDETFYYFER